MGKVKSDPLVTGDEVLRQLVADWSAYLRKDDDAEAIDVLWLEVWCLEGRLDYKRLEKRFACTLIQKKVK